MRRVLQNDITGVLAVAQGTCIICGNSTRRKPNPMRPCCSKCEKTAPTAVTCPGAFLPGSNAASKVAQAAIDEASKTPEQRLGESLKRDDKGRIMLRRECQRDARRFGTTAVFD